MATFNGKKILLAGLTGEKGDSPFIGENGNWWVGTTDTGVSASGGGGAIESISVNGVEQPIDENKNVDIDLTEIEEKAEKAETALDLAKEKNYAKGYQDYQSLINELNTANTDKYRIGQSFLIITLNVPDLWVSAIESENEPYTYTDDTAIVSELETNGVIKIGNYKLSMLETLKQDLTNYVQKNQYGNDTTAGLVKVLGSYYGLSLYRNNGALEIAKATNAEITAKANTYKPIVPSNLNKAVFEGLKNNPNEYTEEEKAQIRSWLGISGVYKHIVTLNVLIDGASDNIKFYFYSTNTNTDNASFDEYGLIKIRNAITKPDIVRLQTETSKFGIEMVNDYSYDAPAYIVNMKDSLKEQFDFTVEYVSISEIFEEA